MDFIGEFFLKDLNICTSLIELFHKQKENVTPGEMGSSITGEGIIDPDKKESLDLTINESLADVEEIKEYLKALSGFAKNYTEKYPACNFYQRWAVVEPFNIQYYPKGGGFKIFHTERTSCFQPQCNRHLVFMTYLNTIEKDGETEFMHQNVKVKPVKGKTLIWPADWTHTHRGIPATEEEKYIVTGWFSFF